MNNYEDEVLYESNRLETPYGVINCTVDTANIQIQLEIEKFLKIIKSKYCH